MPHWPAGVTFRTCVEEATYRFPERSTATALGSGIPESDSVLIMPDGLAFRTRRPKDLGKFSRMYRLPAVSTATALGLNNKAALAGPPPSEPGKWS